MIRARRFWCKLRRQPHPFRLILAQRLVRARSFCTLFRFRHRGFVLRFYPSALSSVLWTDPDSPRDDEDFFARYLHPATWSWTSARTSAPCRWRPRGASERQAG